MTSGRLRFSPVHFLLLLVLLLAGGLTWMWVDQHGQLRNLNWVAPKALRPDFKTMANTPPNAADSNPALFAVIQERPIFAPDRRQPPPPAPPPPPDPLADIKITGIFSGANAGILARVDGKMRRVKVNETVGSWTLKSIDGRDVTFSQGTENRQLRLAYARIDTITPPAPTSAAKAPGTPAPGAAAAEQNQQDEARDRLRRRNEIRAARGLPLITD